MNAAIIELELMRHVATFVKDRLEENRLRTMAEHIDAVMIAAQATGARITALERAAELSPASSGALEPQQALTPELSPGPPDELPLPLVLSSPSGP
jgi:hypothetical protein